MKKLSIVYIINTFLLLTLLLGLFGDVVKPAKAVTYEEINYITFAERLEDHLWDWRGLEGHCFRNGGWNEGSCLTGKKINDVMNYLTDPNGDGDFSDMYFAITDFAKRIKFLENSKRYSYVLNNQVMEFEEFDLPDNGLYKPYLPTVKGNEIYGKNDSFMQKAKNFIAGAWKEGDQLILATVFEPTGAVVGGLFLDFKIMALKSKSRITAKNLIKIYSTPRMQIYKEANYSKPSWTEAEVAELLKVNDETKKRLTSIKDKIGAKVSKDMVRAAKEIMSSSVSPSGGIAILSGRKLFINHSYLFEGQEFIPDADFYTRLFQFSSTPSMAVRYQKATKTIIYGSGVAIKSSKKFIPESEKIILSALKDDSYAISSKYIPIFCEVNEGEALGCYNTETSKLYYLDTALLSKDWSGEGVVVHEIGHLLRDYNLEKNGLTTESGTQFDEAFNDWQTEKAMNYSGYKFFGAGYTLRKKIEDIRSKIQHKRNLTVYQSINGLLNIYYRNNYNDLDESVGRADFHETLDDLFYSYVDFEKVYSRATTPNIKKNALENLKLTENKIDIIISETIR